MFKWYPVHLLYTQCLIAGELKTIGGGIRVPCPTFLKTKPNKFRLVHSATEKWLTASHFRFQCINLRINFSGFINDFLDFFSRTVTSCKKKESLKNSLPYSR